MLRVPLVELCLQIKSLSLGDVGSVLGKVRSGHYSIIMQLDCKR